MTEWSGESSLRWHVSRDLNRASHTHTWEEKIPGRKTCKGSGPSRKWLPYWGAAGRGGRGWQERRPLWPHRVRRRRKYDRQAGPRSHRTQKDTLRTLDFIRDDWKPLQNWGQKHDMAYSSFCRVTLAVVQRTDWMYCEAPEKTWAFFSLCLSCISFTTCVRTFLEFLNILAPRNGWN